MEELIAGIPAMLRLQRQHDVTRALFQEWANLVTGTGEVPVVLLWTYSGRLKKTTDPPTQLGIRVVDYSHPLQGNPETIQPGDWHSTADVVTSLRVCLTSRLADILVRELAQSVDTKT